MKFKKYVNGSDSYVEMYELRYGDLDKLDLSSLSVSECDSEHGSPKIGDMIARDPGNPDNRWLVSENDFKRNYKPLRRNKWKKSI